ncbi:MAG: M48 family metalloprotease [Alphaproteobacteria bacterium]
MIKASDIIYTPRPDAKIKEVLQQGIMPPEIREAMALADDHLPAVQALKRKIGQIAEKIITGNNLDPETYMPDIYISTDDKLNAMIVSSAQRPILILTIGLLRETRTEDELAGVIGHEFGHRYIKQKAKAAHNNGHSKVEELGADVVAVKFLEDSGFNPKGIISFIQRVGEENFRIINVDDIKNAQSSSEMHGLIQQLTGPHPSGNLRIRSMENAIVALNRSRGKTGVDRILVPLEPDFYHNAENIGYESPIFRGLYKVGYFNMPEEQKITTLITLVKDNWPPTNKTAANRLSEIAAYIGSLCVNFESPTQAKAFIALADLIMGVWNTPKGMALVFPSTSMPGEDINNILYAGLEKAWADGQGIALQDGHRKQKIYVARVANLKTAVEGFTDATSAAEAERFAKEIVENSEKISHSFKYMDFRGFYPPTEEMVKAEIQQNGIWIPPYKKHIDWYQETQSENIKKVLWGMSLATDPWVAAIIGPKPDGWNYPYDLHTVPSDRKYNTVVRSFEQANYLYMVALDRDADGSITHVIQPMAAYEWKKLPNNTSKDQLIALHRKEAENREDHDRKVLEQVDWDLLKTNFPKFIALYGACIVPNQSVITVHYPFAEKFFNELSAVLPDGDASYKTQVTVFLWSTYKGLDDSVHGLTQQIIASFYSEQNHKWEYENVPKPSIYTIEHPLIQFILSDIGKAVVNDYSKLTFFMQTAGFITPDENKRFGEIFTLPLANILNNYPQTNSVDELVDCIATGKYVTTAIAVEAENLGHRLADTISMEDLFVLDKIAISNSQYPKFGKSNIDSFFQQLRYNIAKYHLQTDDLSELIENYRYAVASLLMLDAPSLKDDAHIRIKTMIECLPENQKLEYLGALLKPENYEIVPKNQKALNNKFSLKYNGYIEDPIFRNWVVEQYSTALANSIGQDSGITQQIDKAKEFVANISQNTSGITQLNLFSAFANKVNAQRELAYHIRDSYQRYMISDAVSQHMAAIVGELQINETSRDPQLRKLVLGFLSSPLTKASTKPLLGYVQRHHNWKLDKISAALAEYQLQNYHKNFWSASLEMRTVYLEKILFPLGSDAQEQVEIIKGLVKNAFPDSDGRQEERKNNEYAREIVMAYLNSADLAERRLLATAILASNMREEGNPTLRVGQKLHTVLSHMGPAGGKLMQAIHSHPQTPQDIKNDLASSKTNYDPPLRWDVVQLVEDSGLLAEEHPNPVQYIGKIEGSGSFGITVFNRLNDGCEVADTFLRPYAADRAEREFKMMHEAAIELSCRNASMTPLISMIEEARRSAKVETDMSVAAYQNTLAQEAYHGIKVSVKQDGKNYEFIHHVTNLWEIGENFKRVSIAHGIHFNDLPDSTTEDTSFKQAAAKAMLATQLSLRFSGIKTDLDRHGGNIKINEGCLSHFDLGAMNITPLTIEDRVSTGRILAQVMREVGISGKNFNESIIRHIDRAEVSEGTRVYLNGLKKDFLALGDYINCLSGNDLAAVFAKCITAKTLAPDLSAAFNKAIGFTQIFLKHKLNFVAQGAGITIDRVDIGIDSMPNKIEKPVGFDIQRWKRTAAP